MFNLIRTAVSTLLFILAQAEPSLTSFRHVFFMLQQQQQQQQQQLSPLKELCSVSVPCRQKKSIFIHLSCRNGSLLATTSKDKMIRIIDPRTGEVLRQGDCHKGTKASKVTLIRSWRQRLSTSERTLAMLFQQKSRLVKRLPKFLTWSEEDTEKSLVTCWFGGLLKKSPFLCCDHVCTASAALTVDKQVQLFFCQTMLSSPEI